MEQTLTFTHLDGCGTYYRKSSLTMNDEAVLCVSYGCIGHPKEEYILFGKVHKIGTTYYVIMFDKIQLCDPITHAYIEEEQDFYAAFDCHYFDQAQPTEWTRTDVLPIGLVVGNGCYCTEEFKVHLTFNDFIMSPSTHPNVSLTHISNIKFQ